MMGRLEVLQARATLQPQPLAPPARSTLPARPVEPQEPVREQERDEVGGLRPVAVQQQSQPKSRVRALEKTQLAALGLLARNAMSTIEIMRALDRSREHTARLMKGLFDRGLVIRDDSKKPFVYTLTQEGQRYLP